MILVIDDDIAVRTSLQLLLQHENYVTAIAEHAKAAISFLQDNKPELVILDLNFSIETSGDEGMELLQQIRKMQPSVPVILITGWATIQLAVKGMKLGANDFINKPWNNDHLLQSIATLLNLREQKKESLNRKKLDELYDFQQIIGEDPAMLQLLETVGRVAKTDASVLITGESGTGKELIAEAIHENSLRASKPFVKVNLGGISSSLLFTDARYDRTGRFEMANKGTIFLDEIGDLDASGQVKLLRVLQDRTYEILGSSRTKTVDTRIVCATNRDLPDMVNKRSFREDLLYRINLINLHLPPLKERPGDIPLLVNFFINNLCKIYNRPGLAVAPSAMKWIQQLPLPGNIRQLKNLVERSVLVSKKDYLETADFESQLEMSPRKSNDNTLPEVGSITLEEMEIQMIRKAMEFHKGRITRVARALGITRSALYRRLEKYNIPYDETPD